MKYYYAFKKLLSNYYLSFNKRDKLEQIRNKYCAQEWGNVINYIVQLNMNCKQPNLITLNSIKLADKLKKQLDIEIFPVIIKNYLGALHNEEGLWTWKCFDKNVLIEYGSSFPTKQLLLKKNDIEVFNIRLNVFEILPKSKT